MQASKKLSKADIATIIITIIAIIALAITTILISLKDGADKAKKEEQAAEELAVDKRNTQRRQDMARILSAFNDYQANNAGNMPATEKTLSIFEDRYIKGGNNSNFEDPDGSSYKFTGPYFWEDGEPSDYIPEEGSHEISINYYAMCNPNDETFDNKPIIKDPRYGKRSLAILYTLEGGAIYCGDNQ